MHVGNTIHLFLFCFTLTWGPLSD